MRVFVAGHNGMVGSNIFNHLKKNTELELLTKNKDQLDLTNQDDVKKFFKKECPDQVILAAARVGGIHANNTYPAEFIYENLMIQANIINECHKSDIQKLLFLGSSCIYPKYAAQPMAENTLLTGKPEPTNEPYAIAKIAGIKLCESYNRQYGRDFRSIMPTNLYGPGDNFHPLDSHVVPALIQRFHNAKVNNEDTVTVWGSGNVKREFLYIDDMVEASLFVLNLKNEVYQSITEPRLSHINIGSGFDISIKELAKKISKVVNYSGELIFDKTKPDGPPRKLLDVDILKKLGWKNKVSLESGLKITYDWFKRNIAYKNNK